MRRVFALAMGVVLSGCALKGDVRRVEYQVQSLRAETARADSARAAQLAQVTQQLTDVMALEQRAMDSLTLQQRRLVMLENLQGGIRSDLTDVQRQIVQVQELLGQSQQRLSEMRSQLEQRTRQLQASSDSTQPGGAQQPGPAQLYDLSLQQLRRGSPQTARVGFQKFLTDYPTNDHAADAQFFVGETWAGANADSAAAAYQLVVKNFATSPRAASALYKLGLLAEQKGDKAGARQFYQRLIAAFPTSEEAALARQKLQPGH